MALAQGKVFGKTYNSLIRVQMRRLSSPTTNSDIKKSVFISQSNDVYTNLALEDWLYKNFNFKNHHILLLYRNDPSLIIGRKQNPWLETNINNINIEESGIQLARRPAGDSAVYQAHGNLNMTFFTTNANYNSKYNLDLITRALFREYSMKVRVSPQQDLMVHNLKVSSTSSKIGGENAYQQCSVFVNINKQDLIHALYKTEMPINVPKAKFVNLVEENHRVTVNGLISSIGWEYMRTAALTLKDGGKQLANQQKGFQMINPTEKWFPGIMEIRDELIKWDWNYGQTPKFTIERSFPVPTRFLENADGLPSVLSITMTVENGRIKDVTMFIPPGLSKTGFTGDAKVITSLRGRKFSKEALISLESSLRGGNNEYVDEKDKFVSDCFRKVMNSV